MKRTDIDEIRAALAVDTALWVMVKGMIAVYSGSLVSARMVRIAAQMCARIGIPADTAVKVFVDAMDSEVDEMLVECKQASATDLTVN